MCRPTSRTCVKTDSDTDGSSTTRSISTATGTSRNYNGNPPSPPPANRQVERVLPKSAIFSPSFMSPAAASSAPASGTSGRTPIATRFPPTPAPGSSRAPQFHERFRTQSYQPFAEYELKVTQRLNITGGIKEAHYSMNLNQFRITPRRSQSRKVSTCDPPRRLQLLDALY